MHCVRASILPDYKITIYVLRPKIPKLRPTNIGYYNALSMASAASPVIGMIKATTSFNYWPLPYV
jgi:hypothetical protein